MLISPRYTAIEWKQKEKKTKDSERRKQRYEMKNYNWSWRRSERAQHAELKIELKKRTNEIWYLSFLCYSFIYDSKYVFGCKNSLIFSSFWYEFAWFLCETFLFSTKWANTNSSPQMDSTVNHVIKTLCSVFYFFGIIFNW